MYGFPGHDCNQEQNVSPNFSPIVRQCKWSSLSRKILGTRNIATMVTRPRKAICTMASFYYYDQNPFRFNFHIKIRSSLRGLNNKSPILHKKTKS